MKKTSPDSDSFLDRIRSWARSKAHGPSPLSKDSSRSTTLPLSHSPSDTNRAATAAATTLQYNNGSSGTPPYPSTALPGLSQSTANNVGDDTPHDYPPPAPPPQVDGSGSIIDGRDNNDTPRKKKNVLMRFWLTSKAIVLSSYINILLVFVPVGIAAKAANLNPGLIFGMNAIAIVPLAGLLSHATESVAKRMGDAIGALMNITFGNAVELIIFIIALSKNEIRIVQASLLGSILANLLLILGMCFLLGGLRFREQVYNSTVTQMSACLLSLSVMSLLLPTAFHASFSTDSADKATTMVLRVSRGTSVVLLIVYVMYLLFQLKSHAYMYESTPQHIIDEESAPGPVAQWMESSDDSTSSSSSSDSDTSHGSNTTAKRVKRLMRGGRRNRKSSAGSKDTGEASGTVSPVRTDHITEEPQTMGVASQHHDFAAEDADDEHKGRSRRNSHGSAVFSNSHKERKRDKKRRRREKREQKKERKRALRNADTIPEGLAINEKTEDPTEPRRVDFAVGEEQLGPLPSDSPQKRARRLNIRPTMPKTLSQNVFTQPPPTPSPVQVAGTVPRVRVGLRRTNSLPDRLNQIAARADSSGPQDPRVPASAIAGETENNGDDDDNISRTTAVFLLLVSTGLVAICAEFMVDSISAVVDGQAAISEAFIGLIILPIVGNAAEHVTAVTVATKNKMDLAIGVAVGSSIQIALFVTPFIVLLGWCMGKEMSLYFTLFETVSLFVSAFIVNFLVLDGRSNYLEGALLCAAYVIIAVAAFFYPNSNDQSNLGGNADASSKMIRSLVGGVFGV